MSSSLVLLNKEGTVVRKLKLVSLPDDYVIPPEMSLSWRTVVHVSLPHQHEALEIPLEPVEAYFYLGSAFGRIERNGFEAIEQETDDYPACFSSRILTVTVQGVSSHDVMALRDHLMHLVNSGAHWEVHNDVNPRSWVTWLQTIKKKIGLVLKQSPI